MLTVIASSLSGQTASLTASITGAALERGKPGQTITVTAAGITLTATAGSYSLSDGGAVTAASVSGDVATLTVVGPSATGPASVSFGGLTSNSLSVADTIAPPEPTLSLSTSATSYTVRIGWVLESDSYGGPITSYTILQNGEAVATVLPPTDVFTLSGVHGGDTLGIEATDGSGNVSLINSATFTGPVVPAETDVRLGVSVGSGTGTLAVPAASEVLAGVPVDAGSGTVILPGPTAVQRGVQYGAGGTQYTGTFVGFSGGGGATTVQTSNGVVRQRAGTITTSTGIVRSQS